MIDLTELLTQTSKSRSDRNKLKAFYKCLLRARIPKWDEDLDDSDEWLGVYEPGVFLAYIHKRFPLAIVSEAFATKFKDDLSALGYDLLVLAEEEVVGQRFNCNPDVLIRWTYTQEIADELPQPFSLQEFWYHTV